MIGSGHGRNRGAVSSDTSTVATGAAGVWDDTSGSGGIVVEVGDASKPGASRGKRWQQGDEVSRSAEHDGAPRRRGHRGRSRAAMLRTRR